jgi:hypothetical protein
LDLKDLRATADRVYEDTGDERYGDSSIVTSDGKVYEIPALRPSSETRARGKLNNHKDVVQDRGYEQVVIPGLDTVAQPDMEEQPDSGDGCRIVS